MKETIQGILDNIRPALLLDRGNVRLVEIKGLDVYIELIGSCKTCSSLPMTFHFGLATEIRKIIPDVNRIILVPSGLINYPIVPVSS